MRKHLGRLFIKAAISAALLGVLVWFGIARLALDKQPITPTPVQPVADGSLSDFNITLVQVGLNDRRIINCRSKQCQAIRPPGGDYRKAVTDGVSWYHYQDGILKRTWIDSGKFQTIVEQTPLVKPRGLIISPDNQKVAYWLDNIDEPNKQLTELWVYDAAAGSTKLLAEKISQAAVITPPRWNRTSTNLWFIGDTSKPKNPSKIELLVASLNPPGISARFSDFNWAKLEPIADHGALDISIDGRTLAFAKKKTRKTNTLTITQDDSRPVATTVRGTISHIQWMPDGSLIYAAQDAQGFTFWQLRNTTHSRLARRPGTLASTRLDAQGRYLTFASKSKQRKHTVGLFTLDIDQGTIAEHKSIPTFGSGIYLIRAEPTLPEQTAVTDISQKLDDGELANFIEQNIAEITGSKTAQPKRLVFTDKANTVYFDYRDTGSANRFLLTIRDALHGEWSISARYEERGGEWVKTEGGGLNDPKAQRLYDWEPSLKQWILKEEY